MKDKKLLFDRKCHVLYSRPCKKEIRAKIALHYPAAEREAIWEQVQRQYADFLSDWRTDLGGKRNFHNGVGGTYDCTMAQLVIAMTARMIPGLHVLCGARKPLLEEVIRLRQVQNAVDTALRRREQPQEVQRKNHEMEL